MRTADREARLEDASDRTLRLDDTRARRSQMCRSRTTCRVSTGGRRSSDSIAAVAYDGIARVVRGSVGGTARRRRRTSGYITSEVIHRVVCARRPRRPTATKGVYANRRSEVLRTPATGRQLGVNSTRHGAHGALRPDDGLHRLRTASSRTRPRMRVDRRALKYGARVASRRSRYRRRSRGDRALSRLPYQALRVRSLDGSRSMYSRIATLHRRNGSPVAYSRMRCAPQNRVVLVMQI